jgi:Flp pilus assembly pilin Flp
MYGGADLADTCNCCRSAARLLEGWRTELTKLLLKLQGKIQDFMDRKGGPDLVEYALIITLVSLAAVGHVRKVTSSVDTLFTNISMTLS